MKDSSFHDKGGLLLLFPGLFRLWAPFRSEQPGGLGRSTSMPARGCVATVRPPRDEEFPPSSSIQDYPYWYFLALLWCTCT